MEPKTGTAPAAAAHAPWSEMFPIVGSHFKRIGFIRTAIGGLSQYLSIPFWILFHVTLVTLLYQWLLRPLFGLPRVRWADHVIIDRHRYQELGWFDTFNCWFCGYANGLSTMMNTELDHLARHTGSLSPVRKALAALGAAAGLPILWVADLVVLRFIYNVMISRPLGMHRISFAEAGTVLEKENYAAGFSPAGKMAVRYSKNLFLRMNGALEQIESSWCPLTHFEKRNGIVYPDHHKNFFGPGQIEEMRQTLSTVGTVSPRKPTW